MIPTNSRGRIRRRIADGAADDWGHGAPSYADSPPIDVWLTRTAATEVTQGMDVAVSDWQLGVDAHVAGEIGHRDRFIEQSTGREFEVIGTPELARRPGEQLHHLEVRLRLVV